MKSMISYKRKDIADLLSDPDDFKRLSEDMLFALDLARRAPSALNSQMWRFGFEDDYKTITVSMPKGYRHIKWEHPNVDIGICASHLWLGLLVKGISPRVEVYEDDGRAVFRFMKD